ncbi:hypothetical protein RintRC_2655 [Richelia intracellularis]|nr:hypothetical protein RintRC_2655 [Richelia intracellularis]
MFSPTPELASIWAARSLSALLGVPSIPGMFCLGSFALHSPLLGHFTPAIMAIFP